MKNVLHQSIRDYLGFDAALKLKPFSPEQFGRQSWLAEAGADKLILRIFSPLLPAKKMWHEVQCAKQGAAAGIAPAVLQFDATRRVLFLEHLQGQPLTIQYYDDPQLILPLLKQLHQLPTQRRRNAPSTWLQICRYLTSLRDDAFYFPAVQSCIRECLNLMRSQRTLPKYQAFIHNDFHARNLLLTDKGIRCLDWSEAGWGDVGQDLAEITLFLPSAEHEALYHSYFGVHYSDALHASMKVHHLLRMGLFIVWGLAKAQQSVAESLQATLSEDPVRMLRTLLLGEQYLESREDYLEYVGILLNAFEQMRQF